MQNEQDIPLVLPLNAPIATLELVGGKGASLARMASSGLPVPPGFHITTSAYRRFVAANNLQAQIIAAVSAISTDQPATLDSASKHIEQLFADAVIPDEISQTINQAYAELDSGDVSVAVRSSATAEDLPEMSFAGQQETYLNIHGEVQVLVAVKRCWSSLWTARAIGYRALHSIAPEDVSLAVVVQRLVPADASGILFTANPLTGARDQEMINAAWGLGEAIVGGLVTPDTILIDKSSASIIREEIAEKTLMTVRTSDGTLEEPVPAAIRTTSAITSAQAADLAQIGVRIELLYGQPMDIEWALQDGQLFILQARPITALPELSSVVPSPAIVWTVPNPKGSYMRASMIELLPDPLSPLFNTLGWATWTLPVDMLTEVMGPAAAASMNYVKLITINDYAYYDLSWTVSQSAKFAIALLPRVIPIMLRVMRTARQRWEEKERPAYAAVVDRWEAQDLSATSASQLLDGVREITAQAIRHYLSIQLGILPAAYTSETLFTIVYNRLIKHHSDPSALTFLLGFDSTPILSEKSLYDLAQWALQQRALAEALTAMSGSEFVAAYQSGQAAGVSAEIWAAFCQRFAAHLAKFGHTIYDLDFAKPVPSDDPTSLLETLKFFLSGEAPDPYARQKASADVRELATQSMLTHLHGLRLYWFRRLLDSAQLFAPLRENALADAGLGWPVLRRMVREIGQRLVNGVGIDQPDDVFWLTQDEVQAAAIALDTGQALADTHEVVTERRALWERERAVTPPVSLPLKRGARFLGIDFSAMMPARAEQDNSNVIKGTAGSPGRITGLARVIAGPEQFDQMQHGDILVAKITTPAWTPLFALASGIVTDVGGPLSHSSIVAREYHIPAVLGTGVATARLHSGQHVTVDGDAGTVTV